MNRLYKLTFGTEMDKFGNTIKHIETKAAGLEEIKTDICKLFGGYSIISHKGGYAYESGDLVEETSMTIEILADADEATMFKIEVIATRLKQLFNQESVLLVFSNVTSSFL